MKKRVLALFLTLVMAVSVLSVGAFADVQAYDDKDTAINDTSVTANKTVSGPDVDGNYTITISVKGSTTTVPGVNNLPADIVLVVDTSTSMNDTATTKVCGGELKKSGLRYRCESCNERYNNSEAEENGYKCTNMVTDQTRLDIAKAAASQFASGLMSASDAVRMGVYDFSGSNRTNIALTDDKTVVTSAVEDLYTPIWGDGTDYGLGLNGAANILEGSEEGRQKFVVFISDGEPNNGDYGTEEAKELMKDGVTIMTVGVDMDSSAMRYLSNISSSDDSGNNYCYSASSDGSSGTALATVLALIQEKIETSINSGTDAVLTDTINTDDFNLVEGSQNAGLTVSGNVLTWNIGDIGSEEQTVSFQVKPVEGKYGVLHTNSDVSLSFYSTQQSANVIFNKGAIGDPTVTIIKPTAGYTVNYYKDSLYTEPFKTETGAGDVGDEIPYDAATNQPVGYKLDSVTPANPTISSEGDNVVSVLYVEDETATKVLSYTVEYYKDNVKVEGDTQTVTEEIWIGSSQNTLTVNKAEINITDKYDGFAFDYTYPDTIPDTIENDGIIKVYYATDTNGNDIPDYKENKYGVTYTFVSGTEGKELPDSGMPALPSDNSTYLIGITVENKGTTYGPVSADDGTWTFTVWDATQKEMVKGGITFTGTWTFTPNEPEPTKYTIYYHGNGGTTGNGSEQSTSTFTYGSNATIKNNPFTYAGYVFEGWSLSAESTDVVYQGGESVVFNDTTFPGLTANGRVDLYAKWALDEKGGGDDGKSPDGIPDYKQLFVKYASADSNLGSVSPAYETFTLEVDEFGKVLTYPVTLSGTAAADENAEFAYWTITGLGYEGGAYSYDADLKSKSFSGYVAGETYTFTAYFTEDIVKPEPETYTIEVEVINGTAEFMGTNIGADNEIVAAADEDITIAFTPDEGYEFDYVYVDGVWSELGADGKYTFENVSANHSIKVAYKQESVPATPITPLPTEGDIAELIDGKIIVDCVNDDVNHANKNYGLVDDALVKVAMTDGTTVKVTLSANAYLAQYNDDDASAEHSLASGQSATVTFTLKYVDSKWTLPADAGELPATIKVVCDTPAAPDFDDIKALFDGKVFVDCVEKSWHPTYGYSLLANGYTVAGPVKGADGEYTCTVTLLASAYLAEYNDDVTEKHALASYQGSETVSLKWTGSAWTVINGELPVTFDVVCDTWYPPIIPPVTPSEPVYTPNWLNTTDHVSYIIGYSDGTVKPNAGITRAEVATIFFRLLTDGARERFWSETNAYSDVAAGSWYNIAVSTLSNMGILGGYEDGTFRPNASITRAEFAKIAVSFFDWADVYAVNSFVDVRDSAWYANYVAVAAEIGLIEGYGGNVFRPDATITRAEACTIINRTLGRNPDADHLLPVAQMNTWPDNSDTGVWYYAQIQEATNSHDYRWLGDIEQWTAKLADPDWDKLQY